MVFIRRVRTASGATAVQIAQYVAGRQRIVRHVGSAHSDAELGVLMERAEELLGDPGQGSFDLGVEPQRPVVPRSGAAGQPALLPPAPAPPATVGPGRVIGTDCRLLYEALATVYVDLGFEVVADPVFRDLVCARIVEPTSVADCGRVLVDRGQRPASDATMKQVLQRAATCDYRSRIATACLTHASAAEISPSCSTT